MKSSLDPGPEISCFFILGVLFWLYYNVPVRRMIYVYYSKVADSIRKKYRHGKRQSKTLQQSSRTKKSFFCWSIFLLLYTKVRVPGINNKRYYYSTTTVVCLYRIVQNSRPSSNKPYFLPVCGKCMYPSTSSAPSVSMPVLHPIYREREASSPEVTKTML